MARRHHDGTLCAHLASKTHEYWQVAAYDRKCMECGETSMFRICITGQIDRGCRVRMSMNHTACPKHETDTTARAT